MPALVALLDSHLESALGVSLPLKWRVNVKTGWSALRPASLVRIAGSGLLPSDLDSIESSDETMPAAPVSCFQGQ